MVVIINGEIVQDNDPRAQAMKRGQAPSRQPSVNVGGSNNRPGGFGTVGVAPGGMGGGQMDTNGPDGPFTPISRALGVEGKKFTLPVLGEVPVVVAIVAAAIAMLVGPQFGAAFFIVYSIYQKNQQPQQQ